MVVWLGGVMPPVLGYGSLHEDVGWVACLPVWVIRCLVCLLYFVL